MDSSRSRSRLLLWAVPILLITTFVPSAGADVLFGSGLSGLPFFGGSSGGYCGPFCPGGLKLDVGYLWNKRAVQFGETIRDDGTFFGRQDSKFRYPLEGVQVGATLQAPLKDNVGVILRGTWLFPTNGRATQENDDVTFLAARDWSTKCQYYTLDGAGVYPFCAPFNFLAGFRFDSLFTDFKDPQRTSDFGASLPTDRTEVTLNSYIPYVGLALNYGRSLRLYFIGTPIYWADLKYRETVGFWPASLEYKANLRNTYFMEASAEYGAAIGPGTASVLAKWTYMHGTDTATFRGRFAGAVFEQDQASIALIRQQLYVGGSFNLDFNLPI